MEEKIKKSYPWVAVFLIGLMFYKVLIDKFTFSLFNIPLLLIVVSLCVLYFTKYNVLEPNQYLTVSFALYLGYIFIMALTDGELVYVKRGVYEYGFYQMIIFAAAFITAKISKEDLIRNVVIVGFPFVFAGVIGTLVYILGGAEGVNFSGETVMRIPGISRSVLSQGMLCSVYCLFSAAQIRISKDKRYFIAFGVGLFSLLVSGSRGPLVAFLFSIVLWIVIEFISIKGKKAIKPMCIALTILIILAILFFVTDLDFGNESINRVYQRLKRIVDWKTDEGNVGRLEQWGKWLGVFWDNMLFGIGMSRTGSWGEASIGVTESGFVRHLVELGIVGSLLFYNLIVSVIVISAKSLKEQKRKIDTFFLLNISVISLILVEHFVLQITEEITVAFFLWWCLGAMLADSSKKKNI